jgi:hypothetical protein
MADGTMRVLDKDYPEGVVPPANKRAQVLRIHASMPSYASKIDGSTTSRDILIELMAKTLPHSVFKRMNSLIYREPVGDNSSVSDVHYDKAESIPNSYPSYYDAIETVNWDLPDVCQITTKGGRIISVPKPLLESGHVTRPEPGYMVHWDRELSEYTFYKPAMVPWQQNKPL